MTDSGNLLENLKTNREPTLQEKIILDHTAVHGLSFLAARYLNEEHDLVVLQSGAGFYIGAEDEDTGEPVARDSEYFPHREQAEYALRHRTWTQRLEP